MNFKYFLRGLGVGIIFASIICLTSYRGLQSPKLSDEEIIKRAKQLGMVEEVNVVDQEIEKLKSTEKTQNKTDNTEKLIEEDKNTKAEQKVTTQATTEKKSTEEKKTTTEKNTTQKEDNKREKTDKITTEKGSDSNRDEKQEREKDSNTVKLTVASGSSSYPVCQKLEALGMIEDAGDFDTYLVKNGYANRISVGEHILKKGMSYHDIAEAISDPL
ncbi:MAG: hypothetical protein Q4D51_13265 [Eubacteriales bacterium]|nr:hypothetical protein [Eubacteriales bacterium]